MHKRHYNRDNNEVVEGHVEYQTTTEFMLSRRTESAMRIGLASQSLLMLIVDGVASQGTGICAGWARPYAPNDAESIPGTIGITNELLVAMLERIAEQAALNGIRDVILTGDHTGGQPQIYQEVAKKLDGNLSGGARVLLLGPKLPRASRSKGGSRKDAH
jgi:hypothetical protein